MLLLPGDEAGGDDTTFLLMDLQRLGDAGVLPVQWLPPTLSLCGKRSSMWALGGSTLGMEFSHGMLPRTSGGIFYPCPTGHSSLPLTPPFSSVHMALQEE